MPGRPGFGYHGTHCHTADGRWPRPSLPAGRQGQTPSLRASLPPSAPSVPPPPPCTSPRPRRKLPADRQEVSRPCEDARPSVPVTDCPRTRGHLKSCPCARFEIAGRSSVHQTPPEGRGRPQTHSGVWGHPGRRRIPTLARCSRPGSSAPTGTTGATGVTRRAGGLAHLLDLVARSRPPWQADALCREYPGLDWFAESPAGMAAAAAVCSRCLVRAECGEFAADERDGVWGGLTPRERANGRRAARTVA